MPVAWRAGGVRGGGTSLAGQACNRAVVLDWSKYCRGVASVDPDQKKTCVVEPGIVLDELNKALAGHRLMFEPQRPRTTTARWAA